MASDLSPNIPDAAVWDAHWSALSGTFRGRCFSWYRRAIRARCVAQVLRRTFPSAGVYAECGCGSGETSTRIRPREGQHFIAVDFSERALEQACQQPVFQETLLADIRSLPVPDGAWDGIWNLGVLEHFETPDQLQILREFYRVLKPGGRVVLWWPPLVAPDRWLVQRLGWHFPEEPGRGEARDIAARLAASGFIPESVTRPLSDCWTQLLVIAQKPNLECTP